MLTINHTVLIFYHAHKTAYHKEDINPWSIFGILQNSPIAFHGYLPIYVNHDMAFLYLKDDCITWFDRHVMLCQFMLVKCNFYKYVVSFYISYITNL